MSTLDTFFRLSANNTSVRQECLAGLTNFMTMAYLIFVVPGMLADAGMPRQTAVSANIWATVLGTLLMGLWGKYPVAVAPGLGVCAYFSYQICGNGGFTWQEGLGAVFISGIIFLLLTVTRVRQMIIDAVPTDLKQAIVVGMGLFLAFIGMKNCGLVVSAPSTFVTLGNVTRAETLLAVAGVFLMGTMLARGVRSALLIGIIAITILSVTLGITPLPEGPLFKLDQIFPSDTMLQLDVRGALSHGLFNIIVALTLADMFDSMGVLIGLAQRGGFIRSDGHINNLDRAMTVDAVSTMGGAALGVPTVTAYVECAAGAAAGARTGLTAVVTALLFLVSLLAAPLVLIVPAHATGAALIIVGALMMQDVGKINFSRFEVALPAFLTIVAMPLTFNIATGFGFGFISWCGIRILMGTWREVSPIMFIVSLCFAANFAMRF